MKHFITKLLPLIAMSSIMLTGLHTLCMERETSQSTEQQCSISMGAMAECLNMLPLELAYSIVFSAVKDSISPFKYSKILSVGNHIRWSACSSNCKTVLCDNRLWDTETNELLQDFRATSRPGYSVALSPDGTIAFTTYEAPSLAENGKACLYSIKTGQLLCTLKGPTPCIVSAAFSPDGKTIVTASVDSRGHGNPDDLVCIWEVETGALLHTLPGEPSSIRSVAFSPDGKIILTKGTTTYLWDAKTWQPLQKLQGKVFAFSPDNTAVFMKQEEKAPCIVDIKTGTLTRA